MEIEVKRVKSEIHSHDSMVFCWMKWIKVQNERIPIKILSMTATRIGPIKKKMLRMVVSDL